MLGSGILGYSVLGAGDSAEGGAASLVCPTPTLEATGNGGKSDLTVGAFTAVGYGGITAAVTLPAATISFTAHDSYGENAILYTLPSFGLSANGGANGAAAMPSPTLSITGTAENWGSADIAAPSPTLSASGTTTGTGSAALTFGSPNLIGYGGAVLAATLTDSFTLSAAGTGGSTSSGAVTLPMFDLVASGTAQNYGSANLIAPSMALGATLQAWVMAPSATLSATGSAVVVATYEAYALNLNHETKPGVAQPADELTHYTNFPFDKIIRYKNSYYGVAANALYLLEGTTDDATPIAWSFKTHLTDHGTPNKKTVSSTYFGGRLGPDAEITISMGESGDESYMYSTPRGTAAQNYRQTFGKGIKTRYYALGASGSGELALDTITSVVNTLTRKI